MRCDGCDLEYGMAHNCPGPMTSAGQEILDAGLQAPSNGGLGYYLGEGWKIVRWDDVAIWRNAEDRRATFYAVPIWLVSVLIVLVAASAPAISRSLPRANPALVAFGVVVGLTFGPVTMAAIAFVQLGLCHLIAKWFFGATRRFVEVMRPLLLAHRWCTCSDLYYWPSSP